MLRPRQRDLLKKIILLYTQTVEPVGSASLAAKGIFELSSATIRNEMLELERDGYIYQPYTSAGRVPTERGYIFYVKNYVFDGRVKKSKGQLRAAVKSKLDKTTARFSSEEGLKELAKIFAQLAQGLIILAFDDNRFYYTGLSYLYSQPEFKDQAAVTTVSQVLDHCERVMPLVFELVSQDKRILIGRENPFSPQCSFLITPLGHGFIGILGPMRMDYQTNFNLIEYIRGL